MDFCKIWKEPPVMKIKVQRDTKENINHFTIQLDWKGILKLLIHRKIIVIILHYPMKWKMKQTEANDDGTFKFEAEEG